MIKRRKTRRIRVGNVYVGGRAPVSVQSMTNTNTRDVRAPIAHIRSLARERCEIVRVAVPDEASVRAFRRIKSSSPIPVIADVHFNYRIAIACAEAGADGLRINPGNIGGGDRTSDVLQAEGSGGSPAPVLR